MNKHQWELHADFVAMLPVNRHALDDALEHQADIYHRIAKEHTEAQEAAAEAKEDLAIIEAGLTIEAKAAAEKVTEAVAKARVVESPERKKAWKAMQQAKTDADRWGILLEAWRQRGYSMSNLGSLYAAGYFQPTSAGREGKQQRYESDREAVRRASSSRDDRAAEVAKRSAEEAMGTRRRRAE